MSLPFNQVKPKSITNIGTLIMKKISISFMLILFFVMSGKNSHAARDNAARLAESDGIIQMKTGEKLDNPYSVQNMRNAFSQYNRENPNSRFQRRAPIEATHLYIQINPTTKEHLIALNELDGAEDGSIVLHDFPLDHEITTEGDYYHNPADESDLFNPVYTVIPVGFNLPAGLPYQIIEQVYQPGEEEYDVETLSLKLMGWENEEGCEGSKVKCDASETVKDKAPIGPQTAPPAAIETKLFGKRFRPHGYVMVENTDLASTDPVNKMQPLRQAKISIGRGIWWRYTHTDDNGYFRSPKKYRGKVRIRAKWRSNIATIRKSWNEMLGIQVSDHLMTLKKSNNGRTMNILFGDDRLWYKGTVHNGLVKYNDFAAANGISQLISGANVWVWRKGSGAASTPMFKHHRNLASMASIAGIGQSQFWDVAVNSIASYFINLIPARLRPDMLFTGLKHYDRAAGYVSTAEIEQVVFHESGHYSHSRQVGAWHWAKLVAAEMGNSLLHGDSYVDGSEPSMTAGKHISLAEGWATFVEYKAMLDLNGRVRASGTNHWTYESSAIELMEKFDRHTVPMDIDRSDYDSWFMQGIFWDILDDSVDSTSRLKNGTTGIPVSNAFNGFIKDNVFLTHPKELYPIFKLLKSDVYNACQFGKALVSANLTSGPAIGELFHSYGHSCVNGGSGLVDFGNFSIYYTGVNSIKLNWSPVNLATYYQIYRNDSSSSSGSYDLAKTLNAPIRSWSTYIFNDTYFKIRACNSSGCGAFSSPRKATLHLM